MCDKVIMITVVACLPLLLKMCIKILVSLKWSVSERLEVELKAVLHKHVTSMQHLEDLLKHATIIAKS